MANPRNITPHCLQGRKLPENWRQLPLALLLLLKLPT
jgi:hypothetical protein